MKPLPWSFTALEDFVNCPWAFHETRVTKRIKKDQNEHAVWGEYVHKAFEDRLADGVVLPEALAEHEPYMERLEAMPGQGFTERKIAFNKLGRPCGFFDKDVWYRGVIDYSKINGDTATLVDYKGLALDTKLPTPTGWTTMGEVHVGDTLFDMSGKPCLVTGKSQVKHIDCYRVTFDDKSEVVCDHEHLWRLSDGSIKRVTEITWGQTRAQRRDVPTIDVTKALELPALVPPVDPYVLGLWIADGTRGRGVISKPDDFVWEEVVRRGYPVNMQSGAHGACPTRTPQGLRTQLIKAGFIAEKRIPAPYLRASREQRLDLLRGLMDGDGNANPARKQCVYMTTDRVLADQVAELLRSLGQRPSVATTTQTGFGLTVTAYPVSFRPIGINPFLLPRKANKVDPEWGPGMSAVRRIESIEKIDSVPTQCISVDSPTRTFLCTEHMIPTHNTGKVHSKFRQLKLFALHTFAMYPEIRSIDVRFYWTKALYQTGENYKRGQIPLLWQDFLGDLKQYKEAFQEDVWQARPSGLCHGWCPVTDCSHWKPKRKR